MKTHWKILIAVMVFFGVFTAIWLVNMHMQPANEVDAYKKALRDQGEKLELSEVTPAPVPPEQNAADAVDDAFRLMSASSTGVPSTMRMVAPGKAMAAWTQPLVHGLGFTSNDSTNTWDEFAVIVTASRPSLELLQQILARPKLYFHLEYKNGFTMLLPRLAPLKRSAQALSAAAVYDLHAGDTGSALTNICVLLGLVNGEEDERTIISQLVRYAMASIAASVTWEFLQSTNSTDAQLATLQKSWEQLQFIGGLKNSLLMERSITADGIEKLRASPADFRKLVGSYSGRTPGGSVSTWPPDFNAMVDGAKFDAGEVLWRTSWSYSQELHLLQTIQVMLETLRTMQTNSVLKPDYDTMTSRLSSLGLTNNEGAFFQALNIPNFSDIFGGNNGLSATVLKLMKMEACRRVVVTAIALKRFQAQRGHWPDTLADLTPRFISSVPLDPCDGQPLRYRPNADGTYLLYSIGEDGVDDGGDAGVTPASPSSSGVTTAPSLYWQGLHVRDWVWPQPATAAEIEKYYADEAARQK